MARDCEVHVKGKGKVSSPFSKGGKSTSDPCGSVTSMCGTCSDCHCYCHRRSTSDGNVKKKTKKTVLSFSGNGIKPLSSSVILQDMKTRSLSPMIASTHVIRVPPCIPHVPRSTEIQHAPSLTQQKPSKRKNRQSAGISNHANRKNKSGAGRVTTCNGSDHRQVPCTVLVVSHSMPLSHGEKKNPLWTSIGTRKNSVNKGSISTSTIEQTTVRHPCRDAHRAEDLEGEEIKHSISTENVQVKPTSVSTSLTLSFSKVSSKSRKECVWSPPPSLTLTEGDLQLNSSSSGGRISRIPTDTTGGGKNRIHNQGEELPTLSQAQPHHCDPYSVTEKKDSSFRTTTINCGRRGTDCACSFTRHDKRGKNSLFRDRLNKKKNDQPKKSLISHYFTTSLLSLPSIHSRGKLQKKYPSGRKLSTLGGSCSWKRMTNIAFASHISGILKHSSLIPLPSSSSPLSVLATVEKGCEKKNEGRMGDEEDIRKMTDSSAEVQRPKKEDMYPRKASQARTFSSSSPPIITTPTPTSSPSSFTYPPSYLMPSSVKRHVWIDPSVLLRDAIQTTLGEYWKWLEKIYQIIDNLPCTPRGLVRLVQPIPFSTLASPCVPAIPPCATDIASPLSTSFFEESLVNKDELERRHAKEYCKSGLRVTDLLSTSVPPIPFSTTTNTTPATPTSTQTKMRKKSISMIDGIYSLRFSFTAFESTTSPVHSNNAFSSVFRRFPPTLFAKSVSLCEFHRSLSYSISLEGKGAADRYAKRIPWLVSPIKMMRVYINSTTSTPLKARNHCGPCFPLNSQYSKMGVRRTGKNREESTDEQIDYMLVLPHHNVEKVFDIITTNRDLNEDCNDNSNSNNGEQRLLTGSHFEYFEDNNNAFFLDSEFKTFQRLPTTPWNGSVYLPTGSLYLYVRSSAQGVSLAPRRGKYACRAFNTEDILFSCFSHSTSRSSVRNRNERNVYSLRDAPTKWDDVERPERPPMSIKGVVPESTCFMPSMPCTPGGWTLHQLADLLWQTLCGLRHFHTSNHLVHGNLKPSNFIFSPDDGHLILTDIGLPFFPDSMVKADLHSILFAKWHPFSPSETTNGGRAACPSVENAARVVDRGPTPPHLFPPPRDCFSSSCVDLNARKEKKDRGEQEEVFANGRWEYPPYLRIRNSHFFPSSGELLSSPLPFTSSSSPNDGSFVAPKSVKQSSEETESCFNSSFKNCTDSSLDTPSSTSLITEELQFLLHFVAPECLLEAEGHLWIDYSAISPASDAYAVGMMFYWLFHGTFPTVQPSYPKAIRFENLPSSLIKSLPTPRGRDGRGKSVVQEPGSSASTFPVLYVVEDSFSKLPLEQNEYRPSSSTAIYPREPSAITTLLSTRKLNLMEMHRKDDGSLEFLLSQLLRSDPQQRLLLEDARLLEFFCLYGAQRHEILAKKTQSRQRSEVFLRKEKTDEKNVC